MRALLAVTIVTTLGGCAHGAVGASAPPTKGELTGPIQAIDPFEGRITVETPSGPVDLWATKHTRLVSPSGEGWLKLEEIRPGETVRADFQVRPDGLRELSSLRLLKDHSTRHEVTELPSLPPDEAPLNPPAGGLAPSPIGQP